MILKFDDHKAFRIKHLCYEVDELHIPIDIIIYSDKATCDAISKYSSLGYNYDEDSQSGLYARLDSFCLMSEDRFGLLESM